MARETFEEQSEAARKRWETGKALAAARWERGQCELTPDELAALNHRGRWGSAGDPVRRLGRGWTWERGSLKAPTIYRTKREAAAAWDVQVAIYAGIEGLCAHARAVAELEARGRWYRCAAPGCPGSSIPASEVSHVGTCAR